MKQIIINVAVLGAMLAAMPAHAAIVVSPSHDVDAQPLVVVEQLRSAAGPTAGTSVDAVVDSIGNTLATYAAMLPIPTDWLLLVGGFAVIGYAMRTRKRARVSFN